jgi:hypothetical protein
VNISRKLKAMAKNVAATGTFERNAEIGKIQSIKAKRKLFIFFPNLFNRTAKMRFDNGKVVNTSEIQNDAKIKKITGFENPDKVPAKLGATPIMGISANIIQQLKDIGIGFVDRSIIKAKINAIVRVPEAERYSVSGIKKDTKTINTNTIKRCFVFMASYSSYYIVVVFIVPLQGLYAILLEILWIGFIFLPLDGLRKAPTTGSLYSC